MVLKQLSILCDPDIVTGYVIYSKNSRRGKKAMSLLEEEGYVSRIDDGDVKVFKITPEGVHYLYDAVEAVSMRLQDNDRISRIELKTNEDVALVLVDDCEPCFLCKEKCWYNSDKNFLKQEHLDELNKLVEEEEMEAYLNSLGSGVYAVTEMIANNGEENHVSYQVTRLVVKAKDFSKCPNLIEEKRCPFMDEWLDAGKK